MKRPKGPMTAEAHLAWLKASGQYDGMMERQRQQEAKREERQREYRVAEAPLVEELRAAGFDVQSAWDLVHTPGSYPKAVPILLAHLPRAYPPAVREGIARALAVPETLRLGWSIVTKLYREEQNQRVKIGMAAAVAAAADESVTEEVVDLVCDPVHGGSRVLLLRVLERSPDPRVRGILRGLADDPDLHEEMKVVLRRLNRGRH